jgi:hypothetical protein
MISRASIAPDAGGAKSGHNTGRARRNAHR